MCLHNTEHGLSRSRGRTGGKAENAQHAQNAPHAVQRHCQRQHAAHVAQGSVGVFFVGGGWFEPQFPYHTAICSGGGGGVSTLIPRPQSNWQLVWFSLCGTPPVRLCWAQTGHYMSDRHNTPLLYSQETGIATTYCDATSPAPVEKKSLSALKLPKGGPAKRAANSDAPGTRRGPAIPDSVPQAGRKNPGTPHPPTLPPPPSPPTPLQFLDFTVRHLALGCRLRIWSPFPFGMAFRGVGGLLHMQRHLQNAENGVLSSRGGPESRYMLRVTRAERATHAGADSRGTTEPYGHDAQTAVTPQRAPAHLPDHHRPLLRPPHARQRLLRRLRRSPWALLWPPHLSSPGEAFADVMSVLQRHGEGATFRMRKTHNTERSGLWRRQRSTRGEHATQRPAPPPSRRRQILLL